MVQALNSASRNPIRRVLVTGATGFVGAALCRSLADRGTLVRRALHTASTAASRFEDALVGDIDGATNWQSALNGVDAIVHLAARTHVMDEHAADPLAAYRRINVEGTRALARAAREAGARRFVFLSSVKVNGEATCGKPYSEDDAPQPQDAYGVSKLEAEIALRETGAGLETVVLRPPLIYGAGVKGNFLRLMRAVERGLPLPLASIQNRRSLLSLNNLVDAIVACLDHPAAAGQTYLVADGASVATPELVRAIGNAMHKPARLLPFPAPLLRAAALLLGKSAAAARLTGSLEIDTRKLERELGWTPREALAEGLEQAAEWYYQRPAAPTRQ